MPVSDPQKLLARIVADAADDRLDDASFRRRAERAGRRALRALEQSAAPAAARGAHAATGTAGRRTIAAQPSPYRFVAVPNGAGGTTSVSLSASVFEELAQALGGPAKVAEHARKAAAGHKPDSGVSRSAYVRKRLQQRATRAAR